MFQLFILIISYYKCEYLGTIEAFDLQLASTQHFRGWKPTRVLKPAVNYGIYDTVHPFVCHHQEFGVSS